MFDTMTLTKIGGGFCGSLLVFMLGGWFAETIYAGGGHGEHQQAYVIPVESADGPAEEVDAGPPFEEIYAAADAAAGERAFRPCSACHSLNAGEVKTGPSLHGVVGRAPGAEAFNYSAGFADLNAAWTPEELSHFLENPKAYDPNTAMNYSGMRNVQDRANLIAYLAQQNG